MLQGPAFKPHSQILFLTFNTHVLCWSSFISDTQGNGLTSEMLAPDWAALAVSWQSLILLDNTIKALLQSPRDCSPEASMQQVHKLTIATSAWAW